MTKTEIVKKEEELLRAFQNCAVEVLDRLIHESATFVLPTGLVVTKENVLDNYRSGKMAFDTITPYEQKIQLIGDTAVVVVVLDMQGTYNDQLVNKKFQYLRVWKWMDQTWKVIAVSGVQI